MNTEIILINGVTTRKVPSFPNYSASECGDIYRISSGKLMKKITTRSSTSTKRKYYEVRTCHNNKPANTRVCRMVAEAWVENDDPENKIFVNHKDNDPLNDHKDNLEWVTPAQNMNHGVKYGNKGTGNELYNSSLSDGEVHDICKYLIDGLTIKDIASKFKVSKDIIRKIRSGDTYFHVRSLYPINHNYKNEFSESTVRWVCSKVLIGWSDGRIAKECSNKNLTIIEVKRIRYGIRYSLISKEYFKDLCPTASHYGVGSKLLTSETGDT